MAHYTTLRLHNAPQGCVSEFAKCFDGPHHDRIRPGGIACGGGLSICSS